jgi:hypothetical protein
MFSRKAAAVLTLTLILGATAGCSTLITAYLVDQLLDKKAPTHVWSGVVTDASGDGQEGLTVKVAATATGDTKVLSYDDVTDSEGHYAIKFRWSDQVNYNLRVLDDGGNVLYTHDFGHVENADRATDIQISGSVGVQISGVVTDAGGVPVPGAVVLVATTDNLANAPTVLKDASDKSLWVQTNDAGTYTLEGTIGAFAVVCVYDMTRGFAYNFGADVDHNGQIAINVQLGGGGRYAVDAQVVDATATPIADRVLEPAQQFRIKASERFDLSAAMDTVVEDNDLFPTLQTHPSVQQPPDFTFVVAATGANGIATGLQNVAGGNYTLTLLNVSTDTPATALVTSSNPLVLATNAVIVVRVN